SGRHCRAAAMSGEMNPPFARGGWSRREVSLVVPSHHVGPRHDCCVPWRYDPRQVSQNGSLDFLSPEDEMRLLLGQATTALLVLACSVAMMLGAGPAIADGGAELSGELVGGVLDQQDHRLAIQAARRALDTAPNGTSVAWNNPDNGHTGSIAPTRTYAALGGGYCREYNSTVAIDGRRERASGVACRQSDGNWRPLKDW